MQDHILGKNERLDKAILEEKASKSMDVQGNINIQEINHDQVCEEFSALLAVTKMDRHWKVLMLLRQTGFPLDFALEMAQHHGFLKGVRIHEAAIIEIAAKQKMLDTLRGIGISAVVDKHKAENGNKADLPIKIAVPEQGTPKTGDLPCQN